MYGKIINNELIPATNGNPKLCLAEGFTYYDDVDFAKYQVGQMALQNDGTLKDITDTSKYKSEQAKSKEDYFKNNFFEVPSFGWYRKQPKGYSSAIESLNTACSVVAFVGKLPADSLIFYTAPDFSNPEQCTDEWLIANQIKNKEMTASDFGAFYTNFIQAWNIQEH